MKKQGSVFAKAVILLVVAAVCVILTLMAALLIGSVDINLFDLSRLNLANTAFALIIGGIISALLIGIAVLFLSREVFNITKKYFFKDDGGDDK